MTAVWRPTRLTLWLADAFLVTRAKAAAAWGAIKSKPAQFAASEAGESGDSQVPLKRPSSPS
ncbi:MAG: hypothetical protein F4Y47_20355 [Acidobacteriia bacterium]|nr:hypothetical protein [Terriglobia bacterium]MYK08792.1 hypothetical protein [Terriglobia bacterium]